MWNIVLLLLLFVATQIVASMLALLWSSREALLSGTWSGFSAQGFDVQAQIVCSFLCYALLLGLLLVLRLVRRNPFRRLSVVKNTSSLLSLSSFLFMGIGVSLILSPFQLDDEGTLRLFQHMVQYPGGWLLLCVAGPLIEEYVFREGIQRHLMMMNLPLWASVLISAALFAVVHANLAQMLPAFAMGAALGWLYARTGNLRLCALAHILNNTLAVVLLILPGTNEPAFLPLYLSLVIGSFMSITGVVGLRYWWKKTQPMS